MKKAFEFRHWHIDINRYCYWQRIYGIYLFIFRHRRWVKCYYTCAHQHITEWKWKEPTYRNGNFAFHLTHNTNNLIAESFDPSRKTHACLYHTIENYPLNCCLSRVYFVWDSSCVSKIIMHMNTTCIRLHGRYHSITSRQCAEINAFYKDKAFVICEAWIGVNSFSWIDRVDKPLKVKFMKDDKKKKKKRTLVNVTEIGRRFFWIRSLPKPVVFGFYHCATLFIALLLNEMLMKSSLVLFRVLRERIRLWTVYNAIFAKEVKKTMTTKNKKK